MAAQPMTRRAMSVTASAHASQARRALRATASLLLQASYVEDADGQGLVNEGDLASLLDVIADKIEAAMEGR